ncbi:MAG: class I SAM-dependent methyltransferase [Clostridia bacterium]|nr:class I SAM-dependent methyltransferase [Clostridia bacterium]
MPNIENYSIYNDRMRRSMWDKAFFMDKIPGTELLVDYGCADGSLIRFLRDLFPSMYFIGFDIDPAMVQAARKHETGRTWFFTETAEVQEQIRILGIPSSSIAVNYSSVLHEVFHYGSDPDAFRAFISAVSPQYLVVRDMMYCSEDPNATAPEKAAELVRNTLPAWQIRDFEKCWGTVSLRKNLVHLLLKYKYTENWDRECAENYFSYTEEEMMRLLDPDGKYRRILLFRYILPWFRCDLENRFGIDPGDEFTTHFAMILSAGNPRGTISLNQR